jgi:hypothetical protein
MTVFALLGSTALFLTYAWLLSAIVSSYLSDRKGYGEKPGLASGLLLNAIGVVIWLAWPARENSMWKKVGPIGTGGKGAKEAKAAEEAKSDVGARPAGDTTPTGDTEPREP